jgi:hypothetical protein
MYVPKREELTGHGGNGIMRSLMTCNALTVTGMIGLRRMKWKRRRKYGKEGNENGGPVGTSLEDVDILACVSMAFSGILTKGWKDVDGILLAEDRDKLAGIYDHGSWVAEDSGG